MLVMLVTNTSLLAPVAVFCDGNVTNVRGQPKGRTSTNEGRV